MRGNRIPRPIVKLQSDERVKVPKWVVEGMGLTSGRRFAVSVWRKGDRISLEEDAVLFEVVEAE
ncbi:MAG: hypothetical protein ACE5IJ_08820 [Thermoplasmata archaeon]